MKKIISNDNKKWKANQKTSFVTATSSYLASQVIYTEWCFSATNLNNYIIDKS